MLADCLAGDRRFGITPAGATHELPERGTVGCVALVRINQELPDGRSNIIVLGGERFVLERAIADPAPYHVALVEPFEDDPGSEPASAGVDHLRELFAAYHLLIRQLQDAEPDDPELPDDAVGLSFQVAATVEADLGVKQRLLAERSTARRVEALLMLLPILTARVESALKVHWRGHTNGRGGTRPDILLGS
jgi:Lon protease-like protein